MHFKLRPRPLDRSWIGWSSVPPLDAACAAITSSSLNPSFRARFFSHPGFLLLDQPQPRKANGGYRHDNKNGVLGQLSAQPREIDILAG